jgi:hypothetical protein
MSCSMANGPDRRLLGNWAWIPEVYRLHQRTVDVEGYVSVNSIRYSVPVAWIGRRVEVRETRDKIEIELDARHIVAHERALTPLHQRITLAAHRPPRGSGVKRSDPHPEEKAIVEAAPETAAYVAALKQKGRKVVAPRRPRGNGKRWLVWNASD